MKAGLVVGLTLGVQIVSTQIHLAQQPGPQAQPAAAAGQQAPRGGGRGGAVDPRVQQRTYMFADTGDAVCHVRFFESQQEQEESSDHCIAWSGRRSKHDGSRTVSRRGPC